MLAAYRRSVARDEALHAAEMAARALAAAQPAAGGDGLPRYGAARRPNWAALGAIIAAHLLLLAALVTLDVIPLQRTPRQPTVVTLIPDIAPPPPAEPRPAPSVPAPQAVVAPPAVVRTPDQPAPAVDTVSVAPPPAPVVVAVTPPAPVAAAEPVAAPAAPAPVTPPDFSADYLKNPAPRYPLEARRAREQGTVRLKVLVTPDGRVGEIRVLRSSGHDRLDEAALKAVRGWRFAPARQAGTPVAAWVIVPVPFQLQG